MTRPAQPPRPSLRPGTGLLPALLLLLGACAHGHRQAVDEVAGLPGPTPAVVTPLHYWTSGGQSVRAFLDEHPELAAAADQARAACVRLEVRLSQQGDSFVEAQGSGFLVGGRFVLTSGHTLADAPGATARVTLPDGRAFDADVVTSRFESFATTDHDLAVLEVRTETDLPAVAVAAPVAGSTVFALGYPGKHGLDAQGRVVHGEAFREEPLAPLMVVATVRETRPVVLEPLAGAIITGGMSGSPILDDQGRAVGILNQTSRSVDADAVTYTFEGASSAAWGDLVEALIER